MLTGMLLVAADAPAANSTAQQSSRCPQLTYYRDNLLVAEWRKHTNKAALFMEAEQRLGQLAADLEAETAYARGPIPVVAAGVRLTANALQNLVSAVSPQGNVARLASETAGAKAARLYGQLQTSQDVGSIVMAGSEREASEALAVYGIGQLGQPGAWVRTFHDFATDLEALQATSASRFALQQEVARQARHIGSQVKLMKRRYEAAIGQSNFLESFAIAVSRFCDDARNANQVVIQSIDGAECKHQSVGAVGALVCSPPDTSTGKPKPDKDVISADEAYERCRSRPPEQVASCLDELYK